MKLGIMGGTFDPIHRGHLHMAEAALKEAALDGVLFLPDGDPPHKKPRALPEQRLAMVRLAVADNARFTASDMEIRRGGTTYTVDTLLALMGEDARRELYYIIGSDTLFQVRSWHTVARVAQLCTMLVVMRGDDSGEAVRLEQEKLYAEFGLASRVLAARGLSISSSMVRERLQRGESVDGLLTDGVRRYIEAHALYRA